MCLQMDAEDTVKATLTTLPSQLDTLYTAVQDTISQLAATHRIDLSFLDQLLSSGSGNSSGSGTTSTVSGKLQQEDKKKNVAGRGGEREQQQQQRRRFTARLYGVGSRPTSQQQHNFASAVMTTFTGKLRGTLPAAAKSSTTTITSSGVGIIGSSRQEEQQEEVVLSVEEQVDRLIKMATSVDNLAQMFEGWTAWI